MGKSTREWTRVVAQIQAGDAAGQQAFYEAFGRGLRFYFSHHLQREDIEDKVHDTFLAVISAIRGDQLREPERLPGFVHKVARRQVAGYIAQASESGGRSPDPLRRR
jgi:RNA polymerase sigma-70 factor (ECF subfamily)